MKKKILLLSGVLFIFLFGFGLWKINKDFLLLWNSNSIDVKTDNPLIKDKVKIEFGNGINTINRLNDAELFKKREKYYVLYHEGIKNEIINEYGENDFLITYDNKYYFSFRQFKTNRRHQHDYNFHFSERGDKIILQVNIKGRNAMIFEKSMLEISQASQYRCNVPIYRTGIPFNTLELGNPE